MGEYLTVIEKHTYDIIKLVVYGKKRSNELKLS